MVNTQGFSACGNAVNDISVTQSAGLTTFSSATQINCSQAEITNDGPNDVYVYVSNSTANGGTGTVNASTTNGAKVLAGTDKIINKGYNDTISYVCAPGKTATISISVGEGV